MAISSDRDRVRLLIGDTNSDDPLLYDDEVDYHIGLRSYEYQGGTVCNVPAAAADCAGAIAAKFSRNFNFAEDSQRFDVAQRASAYLALEQQLRSRAGGYAVPTQGTSITT